ncbi:hypothetical protein EUGRSUZ_I01710 [Eucalyptus grandis]|uniref:Uncharacterized protein n=2 Tax=Eucalyptus grandis TaxID=71139 RepID=A0A059APM3_EUCGR|nr:hypothetical protein EUGRSUZ_I01710 [Eucalyptus grandis]
MIGLTIEEEAIVFVEGGLEIIPNSITMDHHELLVIYLVVISLVVINLMESINQIHFLKIEASDPIQTLQLRLLI